MKSKSNGTDRSTYRLKALKIGLAVILLPLLPFVVATNFLSIGDRLSSLPGITSGGGFTSGIIVLVYLMGLLGAIMAGGAAAIGGDIEFVGDSGPTATPTVTPTPTSMPTSTPTATSAATATLTPSDAELRREYEHVRQEYLDKWVDNPDQYPTVPELLGTEIRMNQDAYWVVFDETDVHENASRMRDEWTSVATVYLHALNNHSGPAPDRLVAVGWNNTGPITYFRVQTEDGRAYLSGDSNYTTYYNTFFQTIRSTNEAERSIARDIAEHPPDDN